jgi:hypothetical protein
VIVLADGGPRGSRAVRRPAPWYSTSMPHEHLVAVIGSHKVRIARALGRQVRSLSPNYASLETGALESSFVQMLTHIARFFETGDDASLKEFTAHTAQLRRALGFGQQDFVLAMLVFLPVLRQFLIEQRGDIARGMKDYEAFEAVALPMIAEASMIFRQVSTEFDDDDDGEVTVPKGRPTGRNRFAIESVLGGPEVERSPFAKDFD